MLCSNFRKAKNNTNLLWLLTIIANKQAEQRRSACKAASLMPREVLQQAEKFSIVL